MSDFLIRAMAYSKTPELFVKKHLLPMIDARRVSSKAGSFPYRKGHYVRLVFVNSKGEEIPLVSSRRRQGGAFTLSEKWKAPKTKIGRLSIPIISENTRRPFEDWEKAEKSIEGGTKIGETLFARFPETAVQHWNPVVEEGRGGHLIAKVALSDALFNELRQRHDSSDLLHRYLTSLYHVSRLFDNSGELKQVLESEGVFGLSSERPHFIKTPQAFDFASLAWLEGRKPRVRDLEKKLKERFGMHESVAFHCAKIFQSLYARPKAVLSMKLLSNNPDLWGKAFDFPGVVNRMLSNEWYSLKERQEKDVEGMPKARVEESNVKKGAKKVFLKPGDSTPILLGLQKHAVEGEGNETQEKFDFILKANVFMKPAVLEQFRTEFRSGTDYTESVFHERKIGLLRSEIEKLGVKSRKVSGEKREKILALKSEKEAEFKKLVQGGPSIFAQNFTNFLAKKFAEAFPGYNVLLNKVNLEKSGTDYSIQVMLKGIDNLKALAVVRSLARSKALYSARGTAAVLSQDEWSNLLVKKGKIKEKLPPSGYQDLRRQLRKQGTGGTWVRLYPAPRA